MDNTTQQKTLLRQTETRKRCGDLPKSTLFLYIQQGRFPKPVKIGRASAWIESEVDAWIAERIAERDAAKTGGPR